MTRVFIPWKALDVASESAPCIHFRSIRAVRDNNNECRGRHFFSVSGFPVGTVGNPDRKP
jgi:hypothetical protein